MRAGRVARFGLGAVLFLVSLAEARRGELPGYEERFFRTANGASDRIRVPVRAVMQAGTFGTVPVVSVLALLAGRKRLAASLAVGGTIAWVGAKLIKPFGGTGTPTGGPARRHDPRRHRGRPRLGLGPHRRRDHARLRRRRGAPPDRATGPGRSGGDRGVRSDVRRGAPPARRGRRRRPGDDDLGRDPAGRGRLSHPASALGSRRRNSVAFRNWAATKIRATRNRNSIITTASPSAPYRSLL